MANVLKLVKFNTTYLLEKNKFSTHEEAQYKGKKRNKTRTQEKRTTGGIFGNRQQPPYVATQPTDEEELSVNGVQDLVSEFTIDVDAVD